MLNFASPTWRNKIKGFDSGENSKRKKIEKARGKIKSKTSKIKKREKEQENGLEIENNWMQMDLIKYL